jgi:hypothetical protein
MTPAVRNRLGFERRFYSLMAILMGVRVAAVPARPAEE